LSPTQLPLTTVVGVPKVVVTRLLKVACARSRRLRDGRGAPL